MKIAKILGTAALVSTLGAQAYAAPAAKDVLTTYADIAHAGYEDSLITAKELQAAIDALVANPSASTFDAAKSAWLASRVPYQQTEVYRFGNAIVDDWEGKVNAWPLDEGLIDYVETGLYGKESEENPAYTANVIANTTLTISGETIDALRPATTRLNSYFGGRTCMAPMPVPVNANGPIMHRAMPAPMATVTVAASTFRQRLI